MTVAVKRIYEKAARSDGARVLVDRLWPRGVSKERANLYAWFPSLAPTDLLRHWFHAHPQGWLVFQRRYLKELVRPEAAQDLSELYRLAGKRKKVTLLFAARDEEHNNAVVLKSLLDGMRKPPTGTGPAAARGMRQRQARRAIG
jgi:uncharacterized protein YeaO (DUF488 family)